jgi:hypothetical protein
VPSKTADVVHWESTTQNGKIPLSSLETISPVQWDFDLLGPARMYPPAARAMSALLSAARSSGHFFKVKYSYRTLAVQWVKWKLFGSPRAAYPGTSNHGDALSCDLTDLSSTDIAWLRSNAHRFGFFNDVWYESWHWTYYGGWDDHMTEEERRRFKALQDRVDGQAKRIKDLEEENRRLVAGIEDFTDGHSFQLSWKPTRRKIFRALRLAARQPVPEDPSPDSDTDPGG